MYTHTHTHAHTHTRTCTHACTCTRTHTHTCTRTRTHTDWQTVPYAIIAGAGGGAIFLLLLALLCVCCCCFCCRKGKDNAQPMRKMAALVKKVRAIGVCLYINYFHLNVGSLHSLVYSLSSIVIHDYNIMLCGLSCIILGKLPTNTCTARKFGGYLNLVLWINLPNVSLCACTCTCTHILQNLNPPPNQLFWQSVKFNSRQFFRLYSIHPHQA